MSQQWIVESILDTAIFKGAVATWMGFLLIRAIYRLGTRQSPSEAMGGFVVALIISAVGFACLSVSPTDFKPVNANAEPWANSGRVSSSPKYQSLTEAHVGGLNAYRLIHGAAIQISDFISAKLAAMFQDKTYRESPYLFLKTMAATASASIDDPEALTHLHWLTGNYSDQRQAPILEPDSSYSALFKLEDPGCKEHYQKLLGRLDSWADNRWGNSMQDIASLGLQKLGLAFGMGEERAVKNKLIASALVNTAKAQMGQSNSGMVHTKALLGEENADPTFGSSTPFFVSLANSFSASGFLNRLIAPITGSDVWGADARNQSAFLYNRIIQFLPPIRGYAKGALALMFVFAAASMCFGSLRYMTAWFGMLFIFSAFEPLSTLLYETTMLFVRSQDLVDAMQALKNDPLVLSGAAIIDDKLARIQAVYFVLQLGLTGLCAAGGISAFFLTNKLGGSLSETLTHKAQGLIRIATLAK